MFDHIIIINDKFLMESSEVNNQVEKESNILSYAVHFPSKRRGIMIIASQDSSYSLDVMREGRSLQSTLTLEKMTSSLI